MTSTGTNLLISVAGGISHQLANSNLTAPRVLQSVPNTDLEVEVKFESAPITGIQMQGIVFQQDNQNLLRFGSEQDGTGVFLQATAISVDKEKSLLRVAFSPSSAVFLRVTRSGNRWTFWSSTDGVAWTSLGTVKHVLTLTAVGPFAGNHSTSGPPPGFTASVDYIFNTTSPIVPEDGGAEEDSTPPVISGVAVMPAQTSAAVSWATNEPSDSSVQVGTTTEYELGAESNPALVTSHGITVTGLTCETTYHFSVTSTDSVGNAASSPDQLFQTTPCDMTPAELVSDDFSSAVLDPARWTLVDPNGQAVVTTTGSAASVSIPAGLGHGFAGGINRTVRLVQAVPDVDLEVDVRFEPLVAPPTSKKDQSGNTAYHGILVEQDADDYVRFEVSTFNCQYKITVAVQSGINLTTRLSETVPTPPTHLRVQRTGSTWGFGVSFDGLAWDQMVSFSQALSPTAVGPYIGSDGTSPPPVTGIVDYFLNRAEPLATEDGVPFEAVPEQPVIDVWYGPDQTFGSIGRPQNWINILGNVTDPDGISSLTYSSNGIAPSPLPLGMDLHRLQRPGDFNIELPWTALSVGDNTVTLTATDRFGNQSRRDIVVRLGSGSAWPQSYSVDWSTAGSIGQVSQVVDGQWRIEGDEVRTVVPGYDRLINIGETTWTSYEVSAPVTIHGYSANPCVGPAVGFVVGWTGHTDPGQPRVGHPYGGLGWYRGALEIKQNGDVTVARAKSGPTLALGIRYMFKMQMERTSISPIEYTYRLKVWPASEPEPAVWNLTASYDVGGGSMLLVAHHADASFGDVTIRPID